MRNMSAKNKDIITKKVINKTNKGYKNDNKTRIKCNPKEVWI